MGWYLTITEEMRAAGLTGNALLIFALIHGYSQEAQGCYYGSLAHTAEVVGCTGETARTTLKALLEAGLLERFEFMDGGVHRVAYRTTQKIWDTQKIGDGYPKNLGCTTQKIWDNNKKDIANDNKTDVSIAREGGFDFRSALLGIGVSEEAADAWLAVRRKAKAVNSALAFRDVEKEIRKAADLGYTPDQCIHKAAAKSWRGFEAAWMSPRDTSSRSQAPASRGGFKMSPEEYTLRALAKIQQEDGMLDTFGPVNTDEQ